MGGGDNQGMARTCIGALYAWGDVINGSTTDGSTLRGVQKTFDDHDRGDGVDAGAHSGRDAWDADHSVEQALLPVAHVPALWIGYGFIFSGAGHDEVQRG